MMQHFLDRWDYPQDVEWLKVQYYPMIKGVAEFWLSQLKEDVYTGDGTLVVIPCNSPEHGPSTFGCAHDQQLIHQVFHPVFTISSVVEERDIALLADLSKSLHRLDKGLHVRDWGQIKEWKLLDSTGYEFINDTHRRSSELIDWHPCCSLCSFMGDYANNTIRDADRERLYSHGEGKGADANAGWGKP
jgi:alpha-L-fucosidase 2